MFTFDKDIRLDGSDLWLDAHRAKPNGYISHGHSDHIARHQHIFATPETLRICRHRLGKRPETPLPYRQPTVYGDFQLTTFSAGHVLGSAMLLVESAAGSLLYTGDFRLKSSHTCPIAEPPHADLLIMESTYGTPRYRFPDRRRVEDDFVSLVKSSLEKGVTPMIYAYSLGKAQETVRILAEAKVPLMVHDAVYEINRIYEELGVPVGPYCKWEPGRFQGFACLLPPTTQKKASLLRIDPRITIHLTGWGLRRGDPYKLRTNGSYRFPLSDHADYDELLELVRRVNPRVVYCTHGPESFVPRLQKIGWHARYLGAESYQMMMF